MSLHIQDLPVFHLAKDWLTQDAAERPMGSGRWEGMDNPVARCSGWTLLGHLEEWVVNLPGILSISLGLCPLYFAWSITASVAACSPGPGCPLPQSPHHQRELVSALLKKEWILWN